MSYRFHNYTLLLFCVLVRVKIKRLVLIINTEGCNLFKIVLIESINQTQLHEGPSPCCLPQAVGVVKDKIGQGLFRQFGVFSLVINSSVVPCHLLGMPLPGIVDVGVAGCSCVRNWRLPLSSSSSTSSLIISFWMDNCACGEFRMSKGNDVWQRLCQINKNK